ncbi:reverse transcriptase domain-containing protein [Tanacetum coccineum]|uniref:Reverse transcriptase domain-containing protein n=1 Tax=Tanacetum coccineum TaxID=301880 RepID=A0ABQ5G4C4_9ASTR
MDTTLTRQNNAVKNELMNDIKNMMSIFFQMNTASSSGSGLLPSNTIANPRGDLKVITTRSGISYDGPPFPPPFSYFPRWWNGNPSLPVNENCSAVILKKLPEKLGDPGKFQIPCDFAEIVECLALVDLGASINLMPLSIWKKLSLPELTPTRMILELADRSTTSPSGIAEYVFVKVGKFHFMADFVVIDYVVDPRVPLILGRPFLRTECALIDVYGEESTLRVDDEAITFKVAQEVLNFSDSSKSGNPTPSLDPILSTSLPSLTPFEGGDLLLLEKLLNDDPSSPLPSKELKFKEI